MRCVVTGVNADGRSYVISRDELPPEQRITVWDHDPDSEFKRWIEQISPDSAADWIGPDMAGGARFIYANFPPKSEQTPHPPMPNMDERGLHTTRTIDFDYIVQGRLKLILDEESIEVQRGDFVILQAGHHAWENETEELASMVVLLLRPPEAR